VAEFAAMPVKPGEASVDQDAGSDAFGHGDDHHVAAFETIEPDGGEDTGVGGVLHFNIEAGGFFDGGGDIEIGPLEVGREDQPAGAGLDAAGRLMPMPSTFLLPLRGESLDPFDDSVDGGFGSAAWG